MKSLIFTGALAFIIGVAPPVAAADTFETPPEIMNEVNITSDSTPGWIPTADQRQGAIEFVRMFLNAVESGRYAEAYGLLSEGNRGRETLAQFMRDAEKFRALAGPVKFWRVLKVTWTRDPTHAPFPGIYAAVDLSGQFANVDRHCGYIVVYQPPSGGDFTIMRRETSYLDNETARQIEEKQSKAEVMKLWAQLSRYCPNYVSSPEAQ